MDDVSLLQLAAEIGEALKSHQHLLTLAESCTGGLASATVTGIPGSSAWFDSGYVVYSNRSKQDMLGVSERTILTYGAVSEETAREMALGALRSGRATIAASITGIAGPDGGTPGKPVGTVCFAWASHGGKPLSRTRVFNGDRHAIREQSVREALTNLLTLL